MNLEGLTITEAQRGLSNGEFTSVELTQAYLDRISKRNKEINAYIQVDKTGALKRAGEADIRIKEGKGSALTGIPYSVKDAICTKDVRSTGGGKILDRYSPPYNATVIDSIEKEGAVLLGKNNCDAFGHGASNEHSMYGPVRNPNDVERVAGGSSGGSAAAVADFQAVFSIAEDTGGSIRQPASLCGIVGLRPSYGRNSRYGIMPMASSLDTVGPMASSVEDIALLMNVMAGRDEMDATTVHDAVPDYTKSLDKSIKGITVGVPKEYFELEGLSADVRESVQSMIEKAKELGCKVKEVSLPHTKYAIPVYYIIVPSEDSSNLARLDGLRYGNLVESDDLVSEYSKTRSAGFPEEVKRRIMIGTYALSTGYYDAYYRKAQKVRTLIMRDFESVFSEVDALLTPTSPFPAFKLGEKKNDVLSMYLADVFVAPAALAGLPALSIPSGESEDGLPIGTQIIGPRLGEEMVLRVGHHLFTK